MKRRYVNFVDSVGKHWSGTSGRKYPNGIFTYVPCLIGGKEELTYSQGNPYQLLGKSGRTIGGNLFLIKHSREGTLIPARHYSESLSPHTSIGVHYFGEICENVGIGVSAMPSPHYSSTLELDALGTTTIANVLPTNPLSGLLVSLGEFRSEGLPSAYGVSLWKDRTLTARNAGGEYLNHQFGWLPLVSEMKAFTHSVRNSDELIRQYARNSGRKIMREVAFPITSETTTGSGSREIVPTQPKIYQGGSYRNYIKTTVKTKRRWFVACFTYYLPPYNPNGDNVKRNEQLANYLYGTRVTPEGVWDLTPWTWAADWVGNFGDVLHNVSAFTSDGLTMLYGYVMEEGIHEITYDHPEVEFKTYPGKIGVSQTLRTTVKQRTVATPFGFGLNIDGFTGRQWSILVALGLAKSSGKLYT